MVEMKKLAVKLTDHAYLKRALQGTSRIPQGRFKNTARENLAGTTVRNFEHLNPQLRIHQQSIMTLAVWGAFLIRGFLQGHIKDPSMALEGEEPRISQGRFNDALRELEGIFSSMILQGRALQTSLRLLHP